MRADLEAADSRPLIMIMGMLANKDISGYLEAFEGLASTVIAVDIDGHASLSTSQLAKIAKSHGFLTQEANNLIDAVQRAINTGEALSRQNASDPITPPRILICGSLYLAGDALKY